MDKGSESCGEKLECKAQCKGHMLQKGFIYRCGGEREKCVVSCFFDSLVALIFIALRLRNLPKDD